MPIVLLFVVGLALGATTAFATGPHGKKLPAPLGSIPYKFQRSSPALGGGGGGFDPIKPPPTAPVSFGGLARAVLNTVGPAIAAGGVTYGGNPVVTSSGTSVPAVTLTSGGGGSLPSGGGATDGNLGGGFVGVLAPAPTSGNAYLTA